MARSPARRSAVVDHFDQSSGAADNALTAVSAAGSGPEGYRDGPRDTERVIAGDQIVRKAVRVSERSKRTLDQALTDAYALVAMLKDGRMIHGQEYYDHAEALTAVDYVRRRAQFR